MPTIADVHTWLTSHGSYAVGVELALRFADPSPADRLLFGLPETRVSRTRLVAVLTAVRDKLVEAERRKAARTPNRPAPRKPEEEEAHHIAIDPERQERISAEGAPPWIKDLLDHLRQQHKELIYLKTLRGTTPAGMELRRIMERIDRLDRKNLQGWARYRAWTAGFDSDHPTTLADEPKALNLASAIRRRNQLRVWFSQRRPGATKPRGYTAEQWAQNQKELQLLTDYIQKHDAAAKDEAAR